MSEGVVGISASLLILAWWALAAAILYDYADEGFDWVQAIILGLCFGAVLVPGWLVMQIAKQALRLVRFLNGPVQP